MYEKSPDSDPLDALLKQARWPEADAHRLQRLQTEWQQISAGTSVQKPFLSLAFWGAHPARSLFIAANIAAILLIALGFWATRFTPTARESAARAPQSTEKMISTSRAEKFAPSVVQPSPAEVDATAPALVREPNVYELALVAQYRHRRGMPEQPSIAEAPATVVPDQSPPEDTAQLLQALTASSVSKRREAANQLAAKQNPQVSAYLVQMTQNEAVRREALIALSLSTDQVAQRFLRHAHQDLTLAPSLRAIQTMLSRR